MIAALVSNLNIIAGVIVVATAGIAIGMFVRILWLASVISFKITNRGVGK